MACEVIRGRMGIPWLPPKSPPPLPESVQVSPIQPDLGQSWTKKKNKGIKFEKSFDEAALRKLLKT
jgi:hypothetical protein